MILENSKNELEKKRKCILEELEVLKTHSKLLSEVMINAREHVLNERAGMHLKDGNDEAYKDLLHKIYKTEASILTCQHYIDECNHSISTKEDKLKHFEILLSSGSAPAMPGSPSA